MTFDRSGRCTAHDSRFALLAVFLGLATLAWGCSTPTTADATPDAAPDAMSPTDANDTAQTVDAYCVHDASIEASAPTIAWTESAVFPARVDHHATFSRTIGDSTWIYVAGGIRQGAGERTEEVYGTVRRARVHADGALGAWENQTPLPLVLGFHSVDATSERVYVAGGITQSGLGSVQNTAVLVGDVDAAGALGWRRGTQTTGVFVHASVTRVGNNLVVVGGTDGRMAQRRVAISPIGTDGLNGAWIRGADLPTPRSHHAAVVIAGRLVLVGGFEGMPVGNMISPLPDILRAVQDDTGMITDWEVIGRLEETPSTHSSFVRSGRLFVLGGVADADFLDRIRSAPILCDGSIGDFTDVTSPLPVGRSHVHQTPIVNNRLYSIAGRVLPTATSMDRVFIGAFAP